MATTTPAWLLVLALSLGSAARAGDAPPPTTTPTTTPPTTTTPTTTPPTTTPPTTTPPTTPPTTTPPTTTPPTTTTTPPASPTTPAPAPSKPAAANGDRDDDNDNDTEKDDAPPDFGGLMKDMFVSFGPELNVVSATGRNGGPYTSQMVLPSLELGLYARGFYLESELSTYGLALVPLIARDPANDYSWMVPPAAEDPSVHYVKLSLLYFRFGFALAEVGPVQIGLSVHGDARAVVYGVYAGGFDTSSTKMGGAEWTQGLGVHVMWDVVDRVRLDLAAMPFFGFDPNAADFFTSRGGRGFADVSWAVWPDVFALRASGHYEYLDWTTPQTAGVFHITTARVGADFYFDVTD